MSEINERIKIQDLPIFISDGNYSSKYPKNEEMVLDGIPFVRSNNIKRNIIIWDDMKYISEEKHSQLLKGHLKTNDVLITVRGDVGNVAVVSNDFEDANINAQIALLRVENRNVLNPKYLLYSLKEPETIKKIERHQTGTALKQLPIGELKKIDIFVQNIVIQEKIVKVLDKAQELIDKRKEQIEALDELVKSKFIEMFSEVNEYVRVSEYIESLTAGKSLAGESECKNKVLNTGSISYDYFDMNQVKNLPNDYIPKEEHLVNVGDVLISRMNTSELVGATAYVWNVNPNTYIPDRLWKANFKPNCNPIFVWQLLIQNSTKEKIRRIASGTSGSMKNISKLGLLGIEVIKVDIEKQNEFANFVKQVDKLKFEMEKSLKELEDNFNSLMQKAFKGELFN